MGGGGEGWMVEIRSGREKRARKSCWWLRHDDDVKAYVLVNNLKRKKVSGWRWTEEEKGVSGWVRLWAVGKAKVNWSCGAKTLRRQRKSKSQRSQVKWKAGKRKTGSNTHKHTHTCTTAKDALTDSAPEVEVHPAHHPSPGENKKKK